jgi:hypothetical protein
MYSGSSGRLGSERTPRPGHAVNLRALRARKAADLTKQRSALRLLPVHAQDAIPG